MSTPEMGLDPNGQQAVDNSTQPQGGNLEGSSQTPTETQQAETTSSQPTGTPAERVYDWKMDERYKQGRWKSENDVYKSYSELESWKKNTHDPLKNKFDSISNKFKSLNLSVDNDFDKVIDTYKTYSDPNNPSLLTANYIDNLLNHPIYSDKVKAFFQDIENQELQRQFPNMSNEQIQHVMELKRKQEETDARLAEYENREKLNRNTESLTKTLQEIKGICDSRGFNFTDEIKNEFLSFCMQDKDNPVPIQYFKAVFFDKYGDAINKAYSEMVQKQTIDKLNKNKGSMILDANSKSYTSSKEHKTPLEAFKGAFKK